MDGSLCLESTLLVLVSERDSTIQERPKRDSLLRHHLQNSTFCFERIVHSKSKILTLFTDLLSSTKHNRRYSEEHWGPNNIWSNWPTMCLTEGSYTGLEWHKGEEIITIFTLWVNFPYTIWNATEFWTEFLMKTFSPIPGINYFR